MTNNPILVGGDFQVYLQSHSSLEIIGRKFKELHDKKMTHSEMMYSFYLLDINFETFGPIL